MATNDANALGAILYELSAGKPPYSPGESRDVRFGCAISRDLTVHTRGFLSASDVRF